MGSFVVYVGGDSFILYSFIFKVYRVLEDFLFVEDVVFCCGLYISILEV